MVTRDEHLAWCKQRALEVLDEEEQPQIALAWESMVADLNLHDETKDHPAINLGYVLILGNHLSTRDQMAKFIGDF
jgi:hypothetical protein